MRLTDKQKLILRETARFWAAHGYAPTIRDLVAATGLSGTSNVNYTVDRLARLGLLSREPLLARCIRLTPDGAALLKRKEA